MSEETLSLSNDFNVMQAGSKQTNALINNFHDCLNKINEMGDYVDISPYLNRFNDIINTLPEKERTVSETINYESNVNRENVQTFVENLVYSSVNKDLQDLTFKLRDEVGPVYNAYKLTNSINEILDNGKDADIEKIEDYSIKLLKELKEVYSCKSETIKISELMDKSYKTIFDSLLFEKAFGFNGILVFLKEDNDNYSREALSKILNRKVSHYLKNDKLEKQDLDDEYFKHLDDGIGYDYLSSDFLGKLSRIKYARLYNDFAKEKSVERDNLISASFSYRTAEQFLEKQLDELKGNVVSNKKELLYLRALTYSVFLIPVLIMSVSAFFGVKKSNNTPSYQTITRTVDLNTGKPIGNPSIVYDSHPTTYVATVKIRDPWKENKLGSGYTSEVYGYDFSIPTDVSDNYRISYEDIESGEDRMTLKYQYTDYKDVLDSNDSMDKTTIVVTETYQNKNDSKPTYRYLAFYAIGGVLLSSVYGLLVYLFLQYRLADLKYRIEELNFNIENDSSKIADFANQLVDLNAEKEEIEQRKKLYEEKYSETIGALLDDSFGNHKKK